MIPPLYHWSPSTNREGINKRGLFPNKKSVDGLWHAPYVCLAETPWWAWSLSGNFHPEISSWDLWEVHLADDHKVKFRDDDDDKPEGMLHYEWRVYDKIYKRGVRFIGVRENA